MNKGINWIEGHASEARELIERFNVSLEYGRDAIEVALLESPVLGDDVTPAKHAAVLAVIAYDDTPDSTRNWDNLGTLWTFDSRYCSPDKTPSGVTDIDAAAFHLAERHVDNVQHDDWGNEKECDLAIARAFRIMEKHYLWFTINRKYDGGIDEGGLENEVWSDVGQPDGIVFVSKADVRAEHRVKRITRETRAKAYSVLRGEVESYTAYAEGNVAQFTIYDEGGEHLDSCGGFYPDSGADEWAYVRETAGEQLEYYAAQAGIDTLTLALPF